MPEQPLDTIIPQWLLADAEWAEENGDFTGQRCDFDNKEGLNRLGGGLQTC
jgi:hypothetical protein